MDTTLRRYQQYIWPGLTLLIGVLAIGLASKVVPKGWQPLLWLISAITGAVVSFLLGEMLPNDFTVPARYTISRFRKKYIYKSDIKIILLASYRFTESVNRDDLVNELRSEFGTTPSGGTRFSLTNETDLGVVEEVVNLDPASTPPAGGPVVDDSERNDKPYDVVGGDNSSLMQSRAPLELQEEVSSIGTVRLRLTAESRYDKMGKMVDSLFERYNDYALIFANNNINSSEYSFVCQMEDAIIMNEFMDVFDMDKMNCDTDDGYTIVFQDERIHLKNMDENQFYAVKDKLQRIVTYYG